MADLLIRFAIAPVVERFVNPYIDWEDPRSTQILYGTYATIFVMIGLAYVYIWHKIDELDPDDKSVRIEKQERLGFADMMQMMKFVVCSFSSLIRFQYWPSS